jgi:hypothetical protein
MQKNLPYIAIGIVLLYALYNAKVSTPEKEPSRPESPYMKHIAQHQENTHYEEELSQLHTIPYLKEYIIKVINHGSNQFGFKGGEMEGGYASPQDAPKIACYVIELSGKRCQEPYAKDAAMFYSSICAGCHGEDGKGLGGTYPDLTKKQLLGIGERESFLKSMLKKR